LDKPSNKESFKQLQDELIILVETLYLFIKNPYMYLGFKYLFFVKCKSINTHLDLDNDNGTEQTFPFSIEQQNTTINECLLLSYEEALTCEDFASRFFYDYVAHML
jgi:3-deoxy-D-arabino-heptulosonate 7-phosphate (DAHP) synthase class II